MIKVQEERIDERGPLIIEGEDVMGDIGLEEDAVEGVVESLRQVLANIQVLYIR